MSRILIDLPDQHIDELSHIARAEKTSRADVIRQAVASYLEHRGTREDAAFGLWKKRSVDGLEYQQRARDEW